MHIDKIRLICRIIKPDGGLMRRHYLLYRNNTPVSTDKSVLLSYVLTKSRYSAIGHIITCISANREQLRKCAQITFTVCAEYFFECEEKNAADTGIGEAF